MSEYTPGPWRLFEDRPLIHDCRLLIGNNPAAPTVALVCTEGYTSAGDNLGREEALANARLIAAAPDQNKALHVAITVWRDVMGDMRCLVGAEAIIYKRMENALRVMEAAIAKAEEDKA